MSMIDSPEIRAAINGRVARSLGTPRKAPSRLWDHLSFCTTLFWALRKMKHARAGQLIVNVLRTKTAFQDHLAPILFNQEDEQLATLIEEYVNERQ